MLHLSNDLLISLLRITLINRRFVRLMHAELIPLHSAKLRAVDGDVAKLFADIALYPDS